MQQARSDDDVPQQAELEYEMISNAVIRCLFLCMFLLFRI